MATSVGAQPAVPVFGFLLRARARWILPLSALMIVLVASLHREIGQEISIGALYTIPVLLSSMVLKRWQIVILALGCAGLRAIFGYSISPLDNAFRFLISFIAYSGSGLFVQELVWNRKRTLEYVKELQLQQGLRREAEEQLRMLADSSPAAIFTLDEHARILSANAAARRLFGCKSEGDCEGVSVAKLLPVLANALDLESGSGFFRTALQCQGRRLDGQIFVAQTWFSTYQTPGGRRLAAIAVDESDEVREREEQNLRQLQDNNRIVAAAVSHEIRNVCSAIAVVYSNLERSLGPEPCEDLQALGKLVRGLEKIASAELQSRVQPTLSGLDLGEVLNHFRIIVEPGWDDIGGEVVCRMSSAHPLVVSEPFGLTQVFLNLSANSLRAVQNEPSKRLEIMVEETASKILIYFHDSGPGVANPDRLFQLFQSGAEHVGLGLYVSRAIMRSHGGDLRYEPNGRGARFVVELARAPRRGAQTK